MGRLLFLFVRVLIARCGCCRTIRARLTNAAFHVTAIRRTMRTMHGGCEARP